MSVEPRPRLLVTGVSGSPGSRVKALAPGGAWDLVGTSRSGAGLRMDLLDKQSVRDVMTHARPAVVVHAAYVKDVPEMDAVIVSGSAAVAAECERVGARLIYVSTDAVFLGRPRARVHGGRPGRSGDGVREGQGGRRGRSPEWLRRYRDRAYLAPGRSTRVPGAPGAPRPAPGPRLLG